jgi:glutamate/tyrosine decarboxylase-like PLP-dependent enzyme
MTQLRNRIRGFEQVSRRLDLGAEERARITAKVTGYAAGFLDQLGNLPVYVPGESQGEGLYTAPIGENPTDMDTLIELVRNEVDGPSLNPASGGHLGYVPGGGVYPAALGDYLADVSNRFAGVYFASPGAVRMEHMLVRWMCDLVGYPEGAGGDLTSGGSIATLIGVHTAREALGLRSRHIESAVVYTTAHVHHSIGKALRIAGLGECVVRTVDMDDRYRMRSDALESTIADDAATGLRPWLVVASAGTTDTGAVDPLDAIADLCEHHGLWLHVDASYGGVFMLCHDGPAILKGIGRADSIQMDPHKGLFLPYGCGAVLVRDREKLRSAHTYRANYMQDASEPDDEYSPADHSPELTRHFRGLRLWLPLKLFGVAPFRACLEEKLLLARYFHQEIRKIDGFEAGPPPELSVVTYRYVPPDRDADAFNKRLVTEVQHDGRVFISSTVLDGNFTLRMAALCFRTHLDRIDTALEVLREKARAIAGGA